MDNELDSLEKELMALRPKHLTPTLVARIHAQLRPDTSMWFSWAGLPAVLALGVGALVAFKAPAAEPQLRQVAAGSTLIASHEALVPLSDGSLACLTRSSSVDSVTWKDASGHASLTWSVDREEATVTPLVYE